jgi:SAM-dependent methyltransferase
MKSEQIYQKPQGSVRREFSGEEDHARRYYKRYVEFVLQSAPPRTHQQVLEFGCGSGWSSELLRQKGFDVVGMDLDGSAFEPDQQDGLKFSVGSAIQLPFADASFDVVTSYQVVEHIEQPEKAFAEMYRVCRPGGVLIVAGPNLISLGNCLRNFGSVMRMVGLGSGLFVRKPETPRLPFGSTIPESVYHLIANLYIFPAKLISSEPGFIMREADTRPPFRGDNDACYLLNPIDVMKYFQNRGCKIIKKGAYGRPETLVHIAGGTWVAMGKK